MLFVRPARRETPKAGPQGGQSIARLRRACPPRGWASPTRPWRLRRLPPAFGPAPCGHLLRAGRTVPRCAPRGRARRRREGRGAPLRGVTRLCPPLPGLRDARQCPEKPLRGVARPIPPCPGGATRATARKTICAPLLARSSRAACVRRASRAMRFVARRPRTAPLRESVRTATTVRKCPPCECDHPIRCADDHV